MGYPTLGLIWQIKDYADNDNFKLIDQIINAEIANGLPLLSWLLPLGSWQDYQEAQSHGNVNSTTRTARIKDGKAADATPSYDLPQQNVCHQPGN